MKCLLRACALSWVVILGIAANARAQEAGTAPLPWALRLVVDEQYESNAQPAGQTTDSATRAGVGLTYNWIWRRARVNFAGDANQIFHRRATNLDQLSYSVAAGISYPVTRRLIWDVSESLTSTYSQDTNVLLTDVGVAFPKVVARVNAASTQLRYNLSERTEVGASLGGQRVSFDSSTATGGSTMTLRANFSRQVSRSQSLGLSWGQTISDGITGDIQGLLATWVGKFGTRLTVNAAAGIRPYRLQGQSGYKIAPGGSAELVVAALPHGQAISARYERAVEQAYGFSGTHLAHRFSASYNVVAGRRLTLAATGNYGINRYPLDPTRKLDGRTANIAANYLLVGRLGVSAGYAVWAVREGDAPSATSYRATTSLTYGWAWR